MGAYGVGISTKIPSRAILTNPQRLPGAGTRQTLLSALEILGSRNGCVTKAHSCNGELTPSPIVAKEAQGGANANK